MMDWRPMRLTQWQEWLLRLPQFERDNPSDAERAGLSPLTDENRRLKKEIALPELPRGSSS